MPKPKDYRAVIGGSEYYPLMIGGMGVDVSTSAMVLEAARLGCIAHLSDAMVPAVCDKNFGTTFTKNKVVAHNRLQTEEFDQDRIPQFDFHEYRLAQIRYVSETVEKKKGTGGVFVNCMEKLQIGSPLELLGVRLNASLDAGADGISLSAGLHTSSMKLMADHPRFREAKIGVVVSSWRALKLFLRAANIAKRMPDYIVVEGPLAGGHLGFGDDWRNYVLKDIVVDIQHHLEQECLRIPLIPAGGIFDAEDASSFLETGAAAVQVATRFAVSKESGLPDAAKQKFFEAEEKDVFVAPVSPTGYPIRMLHTSPCLGSNIVPQCMSFGYAMNPKGQCQYIDAYKATGLSETGEKLPVVEKVCLCHHISHYDVWTCGSNVVRLKDTVTKDASGIYQQPTTEQVIQEYLGEPA